MNATEIVIAVVTVILAPVIAWVVSRRKQRAEEESTIVTGAHQAVDAMVAVVAEVRAQVEELKEEAECLRRENVELQQQVKRLSEENRRLAKDVERLTSVLVVRCPECDRTIRP